MDESPAPHGTGPSRSRRSWPTVATLIDRCRRAVVDGLADWMRVRPLEVVGLSTLLAGTLAATMLVVTIPHPSTPTHAEASAVGPHAAAWDASQGHPSAAGHDRGAGGAAVAGQPGDQPPAGGPPMRVHVSGAVHAPGVVVVPEGSRVGDVIVAAGGPRFSADLDAVNLARVVADGEQVRLPFEGEHVVAHRAGGPAGGGDHGPMVNINRASASELTSLPGVGPTRAQAIVEHRQRHGPFRVPGDLRAVSGIGEATFQNLAERITVQ